MGLEDIFQAAEIGDADEVRQLLVLDPTLANAENQDGLTVLGIAAHYGHREVWKCGSAARLSGGYQCVFPFPDFLYTCKYAAACRNRGRCESRDG